MGKLFIEPGDTIAVEAPSYVGALSAFSVYEPSYLQIPMDEDGLVVDALEDALQRGDRRSSSTCARTSTTPRG